MVEARLPEDEEKRLASLHAYGILDTRTEEAFDRIARLAKRLCQTPVALVSLVDEDRQWFKACIGMEHRETERPASFCAYAILEPDEVTHIPDLREDERTEDNRQVTGEPGFRFYAGAPITTPEGHALGTVCVLDHEPRTLDDDQRAGLEDLAAQAGSLIEERYGAASIDRERAFLASVLDALDEHVAIVDDRGRIAATNEAWDRFARENAGDPGPGGDYLEAARVAAMDGDEIAREAAASLEALLDGEGGPFGLAYPCHGPDVKRWFRMEATAFEDRGRRWAVLAHRDITGAKLAEMQRERLADIIEVSPDGIGWAEPDGRFLYMNDGLEELLELPSADHTYTFEELMPADLLDQLWDEKIPTARQEGYWTGESRLVTATGEELPVHETIIAHESSDGELSHLSAIYRDLRPQRAAQRVLLESEERFREMAEHLDVVSWLVAPDLSEVYYVSPAFERVFERSRDAFYEDPSAFLDWVHPEDREQVLDALAQVATGAQTARYRILLPDGSTRRVESRGFPVRDEQGELDRVAGLTRDVTQEEQARAFESQRIREATRAVELEQLVFATSHTLRTEVRRIRSFGQLLQQRAGPELEEQIREPLEEILEGSIHLEQLHEALREYAETTRGQGTRERVDLAGIVREVIAARSAEIEGPGGGSVVGEIAPVQGDGEQLYKLMTELVDNAVKFRRDVPVELSIEAEDRGETVMIHVRDNGQGFDPDYAERIFGLFQQLEPATTDGVGIGLTICRRIVENHGGTIHADAEPGKGATFSFTLPKV